MRDEHALYAIEMEGAGVAESAWQFDKYYLVVRSACDYGHPKGIHGIDTLLRLRLPTRELFWNSLLSELTNTFAWQMLWRTIHSIRKGCSSASSVQQNEHPE